MTSRMSFVISKMQSLIRAGLLPYWDMDPEEIDSDGKPGPFMNIEANFHNNDHSLDLKMETSQGTNEFKDYPLSMDWGKRLRNLKFTKTIKNLIEIGILSTYHMRYYTIIIYN
jgi:hypothetical protein